MEGGAARQGGYGPQRGAGGLMSLASPSCLLAQESDDDSSDGDLRADEGSTLNPQGAVKLAAGNEFLAIGTGGGAHRLRDGFGLGPFDTACLELPGGGKSIECVGIHWWSCRERALWRILRVFTLESGPDFARA